MNKYKNSIINSYKKSYIAHICICRYIYLSYTVPANLSHFIAIYSPIYEYSKSNRLINLTLFQTWLSCHKDLCSASSLPFSFSLSTLSHSLPLSALFSPLFHSLPLYTHSHIRSASLWICFWPSSILITPHELLSAHNGAICHRQGEWESSPSPCSTSLFLAMARERETLLQICIDQVFKS